MACELQGELHHEDHPTPTRCPIVGRSAIRRVVLFDQAERREREVALRKSRDARGSPRRGTPRRCARDAEGRARDDPSSVGLELSGARRMIRAPKVSRGRRRRAGDDTRCQAPDQTEDERAERPTAAAVCLSGQHLRWLPRRVVQRRRRIGRTHASCLSIRSARHRDGSLRAGGGPACRGCDLEDESRYP